MASILAWFERSEAQLQLLSQIVRTDPTLAKRIRRERQLQRRAFQVIVVGYLFIVITAIALPVQVFLHHSLPRHWFALLLPYAELVFLTPVIVLLFHVERSYRRFGL